MDFYDLKIQHQKDHREWSQRACDLITYKKVLDGTIYNCLKYSFHQSQRGGISGNVTPIPMSKRRPSVKYRLAKIIVNQSIGLVFGEGHFPQIQYYLGGSEDVKAEEEKGQEIIDEIIKKSHINKVMLESAYLGSVGSIAIIARIIKGKITLETLETAFLTPEYDPDDPSRLIRLFQKYRVKGADLYNMGYTECDSDCDYWYMWELNEDSEIYYIPMKCDPYKEDRYSKKHNLNQEREEEKPRIDKKRSPLPHDLGFIPAVWIKNLPGSLEIDGLCTFEPAIDFGMEIDYQLSQTGRGLRYSSDPLLVIKNGIGAKDINPGAGDAIVLDENGDAKFAEISGDAANAVLEYVSALRDMALESVGGDRINPEKITMTHSGKAMKMLKEALIFVSDELRTMYGEVGLVELMNIIIKMNQQFLLMVGGDEIGIGTLKEDVKINLIWPDWFPSTTQDRKETADTLKTLKDANLISQETGVSTIQKEYDIVSVDDELGNISDDEAKLEAKKPEIKEVVNV